MNSLISTGRVHVSLFKGGLKKAVLMKSTYHTSYRYGEIRH